MSFGLTVQRTASDRGVTIKRIRGLGLFALAALVVLPHPQAGLAQEPAGARQAPRVRLTLADDSRVAGDFQGRTGDDVTLAIPDAGSRSFELGAIQQVEISRGTRRTGNLWRGAAIGGLAGAASGLLLGGLSYVQQEGPDGGFDTAVAVGIGFAVGATAGAIIGSGDREEVWESVPLESLRLGFGPVCGGGWHMCIAVVVP